MLTSTNWAWLVTRFLPHNNGTAVVMLTEQRETLQQEIDRLEGEIARLALQDVKLEEKIVILSRAADVM